MSKSKIINKNLVKYFLVLLVMILLGFAKVEGISPFLYAFLFALMWTNFNVYIIALEYGVVSAINYSNLEGLYCTIFTIFIMLFCYLLHKKIKLPMNPIVVGFYSVISQVVYFYYNFIEKGYRINTLIYLAVGCLFLYCCINILQVLVLRRDYMKLTLDESVCGFFFLLCLGIGLAKLNYPLFNSTIFIVAINSLLLVSLNKPYLAVIMAVALGLGGCMQEMSLVLVSECVVIALSCSVFRYSKKYLMAFTLILFDFLLQLYFINSNKDVIIALIPVALACVLFLCIPKKVVYAWTDRFHILEAEISMRNVINITKKNLHKRLNNLSKVFLEMKNIHINMLKNEMTKEEMSALLTQELKKTMCKDCLEKNKCFRAGQEIETDISALINLCICKGKITLLDIPTSIAIRCKSINLLIGKLNAVIKEYNVQSSRVNDINNVKLLLADQMGVVSKLLVDLGDEIDKNVHFDANRESKIINKLLEENILCSEVLLYTEKDGEDCATILVKGEQAYNPAIEKIVGKILKTKMKVESVVPTETAGFYSVNLVRESNYDIIFGLTTRSKDGNTTSGDSHSLIRLSNSKYLVALCDGMGSGTSAQKMSALTLGLIENFYKAGLNNDLVLNSVNKLLAVNNQEMFSTLDLCFVDIDKELIDFVKVGAPFGLIKKLHSLEKIEGGALPIGVVDQIRPIIYKTSIATTDMVIMFTDGISDAFSEYEEIESFVNGLNCTNPETVSKAILDEALKRNGNQAKDDMTVIAFRTILKNQKGTNSISGSKK